MDEFIDSINSSNLDDNDDDMDNGDDDDDDEAAKDDVMMSGIMTTIPPDKEFVKHYLGKHGWPPCSVASFLTFAYIAFLDYICNGPIQIKAVRKYLYAIPKPPPRVHLKNPSLLKMAITKLTDRIIGCQAISTLSLLARCAMALYEASSDIRAMSLRALQPESVALIRHLSSQLSKLDVLIGGAAAAPLLQLIAFVFEALPLPIPDPSLGRLLVKAVLRSTLCETTRPQIVSTLLDVLVPVLHATPTLQPVVHRVLLKIGQVDPYHADLWLASPFALACQQCKDTLGSDVDNSSHWPEQDEPDVGSWVVRDDKASQDNSPFSRKNGYGYTLSLFL